MLKETILKLIPAVLFYPRDLSDRFCPDHFMARLNLSVPFSKRFVFVVLRVEMTALPIDRKLKGTGSLADTVLESLVTGTHGSETII